MSDFQESKDLFQAWSHFMGTWLRKAPAQGDDAPLQWALFNDLGKMYQQAGERLLQEDPSKLLNQQLDFWKQQMAIFQNTLMRMGGAHAEPVVVAEKGDRRFESPEWDSHPWFDYLRQSYLLLHRTLSAAVEDIPGLDDKTQQRIRFFTRQWLSAMSPGNFPVTNPEVLKLTLETGGTNLVHGLQQLAEDLENSADSLNIRMTDRSAFRLGENIATTPGSVVYRHELFELIQYAPSTESVYQRPLLVVPPWINKYYVLDLRHDNSFVRYARDQGHTVFIVSWVNPGRQSRDWGIDFFMKNALLQALSEIKRITGEPEANVVGYCAGGILLALTLGAFAGVGEALPIHSATHLATLFDYHDAGDVGVFIDEVLVHALEQELDRQGVLDGRMLAVTFSMLRENDLYWNYFIQNYLKGERPIPFDMLYWNTDSTNVPAAVHKFFLRQLYINNRLKEPSSLTILDRPVDVSKVTTPAFIVATRQDHIAKWPGCYAATQLYKGPVEFVLGESGHVAGILNPPGGRYGHFRHSSFPVSAQEWFSQAEFSKESWWSAWSRWLEPHGGSKVPARTIQSALEPAPGRYVRVNAIEALLGQKT